MKSILVIVTTGAALGMIACESTPPQDAAIWNKPSRYGHGGTQDVQKDPNASADQEKKNRFGFEGGDANATTADAAGNTEGSRFGAGSPPPANGNLGSTPGNTTGNKPPADGKKNPKSGDTAKTGTGGSKSSPPSNLKSYPFGKPVPGKGGFVTLPSPHDGLGEIDVRGIAPGTPVEIPDPTKPGKKIYFRVP